MVKSLSNKRKRFADEYIKDLNATQACIRAGYSERSARDTGSTLINTPEVKAYISDLMKESFTDSVANATEILENLTKIIRGQCTEELVLQPGMFKTEPIRVRKEVSTKDRLKALELLAKYHGLLTDNVNLNQSGTINIHIESDYGDCDVVKEAENLLKEGDY